MAFHLSARPMIDPGALVILRVERQLGQPDIGEELLVSLEGGDDGEGKRDISDDRQGDQRRSEQPITPGTAFALERARP